MADVVLGACMLSLVGAAVLATAVVNAFRSHLVGRRFERVLVLADACRDQAVPEANAGDVRRSAHHAAEKAATPLLGCIPVLLARPHSGHAHGGHHHHHAHGGGGAHGTVGAPSAAMEHAL